MRNWLFDPFRAARIMNLLILLTGLAVAGSIAFIVTSFMLAPKSQRRHTLARSGPVHAPTGNGTGVPGDCHRTGRSPGHSGPGFRLPEIPEEKVQRTTLKSRGLPRRQRVEKKL